MDCFIASALFDSVTEAENAVAELHAAGVPQSAISIVTQQDHSAMSNDTVNGDSTGPDKHGSVLRGILGGGALGAGLGVAALAIPGVGPLVAAGAIAAAAIPSAVAIGAVAGAAAGTLNETLVEHGVSKEDAVYYSDNLGAEGILVSVDTPSSAISTETASDILYRNGGHTSTRSRLSSSL